MAATGGNPGMGLVGMGGPGFDPLSPSIRLFVPYCGPKNSLISSVQFYLQSVGNLKPFWFE